MKAISLWQPWATLIAIGAKTIETRSWSTKYRGPLAIHAAKHWIGDDARLCATEPFRTALTPLCPDVYFLDGIGSALPKGALVAICELAGCVKIKERHYIAEIPDWIDIPPAEPERSFGDYTPGRYAWVLKNIQALATPIPYRGSQGFFEVPDELLEAR